MTEFVLLRWLKPLPKIEIGTTSIDGVVGDEEIAQLFF